MGNIKKVIAGNWKMNLDLATGLSLVKSISKSNTISKTNLEIIIAPAYPYLLPIKNYIKKYNSKIKIASQDVHYAENGAYTGKVSVEMLKDLEIDYCLIGHSEQRQYFHEKDQTVNLKAKRLLASKIKIIICIGETLEEKEKKLLSTVLKDQLEKGLNSIKEIDLNNIIIAYEPVWAIGTGLSAKSHEAEKAHQIIRNNLANLYKSSLANKIPILYGGSVNSQNILELVEQKNIDGALVGSNSLKSQEFLSIIEQVLQRIK